MLLQDLQMQMHLPITICYDNANYICIATNLRVNPRTSHIEEHYHFTIEKIQWGKINLQYVPTLAQVANIFTKPLRQTLFGKFQEKINVTSLLSIIKF